MLVPCSACNRHVRDGEICPFCGVTAPRVTASPIARSSRAALLALASMACGEPAHVVMYGAPPTRVEADAEAPPPQTVPSSSATTNVSAYGGPPTTSPQK